MSERLPHYITSCYQNLPYRGKGENHIYEVLIKESWDVESLGMHRPVKVHALAEEEYHGVH